MDIEEQILKEIEKEEKKMESLRCIKCDHPEVVYFANKDMGYCEICADILGLEVSPNVIAPKNEEQEEDIDMAI